MKTVLQPIQAFPPPCEEVLHASLMVPAHCRQMLNGREAKHVYSMQAWGSSSQACSKLVSKCLNGTVVLQFSLCVTDGNRPHPNKLNCYLKDGPRSGTLLVLLWTASVFLFCTLIEVIKEDCLTLLPLIISEKVGSEVEVDATNWSKNILCSSVYHHRKIRVASV